MARIYQIVFILLLALISNRSNGAVAVTLANASICKNYAVGGVAARWTTLGTMTLTEGQATNIGNVTGTWSVTIVLAAPTGWQFNTAALPTLGFTAAKDVTSVTRTAFTSSALTFVISGTNKIQKDVITIAGLQVQATSSAAVSGNIKPSSVTGTISGVSTTTNFGTLTHTTASAGTASVAIAVTPTGAICAGTTVTFTATPTNGGTPLYQWQKNATNISGATNSTYNSSSLVNGDAIRCTMISSSCITTASATSSAITTTVNALPDVSSYAGTSATSPCLGSASSLSVNSSSLGTGTFVANYSLTGTNTGAGYTDVLTMSGTTGSLPIQSSVLSASGATTITVNSLTNAAGCVSTLSSGNVGTFTVNALPSTVSVSGGGTVCGSTTLTASNGSSGTIYYQGITSGGTSTATPSVSQSVSSAGTYYFRAQSTAGCWGTQGSATVAINALPTAVTASGGGAFCTSTTITASNGGSGTIYYQGTTSGGTSTATPSTSQVISTSGTYYFRAQSAAGCWGAEGSVTVTINPNPASFSGASVCSGATTTLTNSTPGGTWSSVSTSAATIGSGTGVVTGVAQGTSVISYTLPTGCASTATVTVLTTPAAISGSTAVCGGSAITLSDATLNGTWSSSNAGVASVGSATGIVTGVANGTATISYSTGCGSAAVSTITVGSSPITGTKTVCSGSSTTLSNAIAGGTWTSGSTGIATVGSLTGVVTGVSGGTATISYTSGGCTSTVIVTVNTAPVAIGGTASACVGLTSTLTDATNFGTWASANTGTATVGSATGIVTGVAAGTVTISYSTGCGSAATKVYTVNTLPASITGTTNVCVSSTTTLADATLGGTWTSASTGVATIGSASGVVSGVSAGTSNITYTLTSGCLITSTVTVNPLPASITGTTTICNGLTSTLSDATTGGTWSSSNTGVASIGSATGIMTGAGAGTATISYTLSTGCKVTAPVTINALPSAISGTASVCIGSTTTLTDAGGGTWTSSNPLAATIGSASGLVLGIVANTVNITYTLPTGCLTTTVLTVNPLPTAISGTTTVCELSTTTLSSTVGGTWTSSSTASATIGSATGIVTGVSAGSPVISYTLPTGCRATTTITVNPLPNAGTISGTAVFCEAGTSTLTDAAPGGTWSSSDISNADVDAAGVVTGASGGTATISYSVTNSCGTADATFAVTVNPLPAVDVISGSNTVCNGSTTALSNTVAGGTWTSSSTSVATIGSATGVVTGASVGTTLISYTATNGCGTDFDTLTVSVLALPSAISGTATVCVGATTTLTNAGGGTWTSGNTGVATIGSASGVVTGVAAGTATITYTLSTGCSVTTRVTVNALPTVGAGADVAICNGGSTSLTATGASTYTWSPTTGLTSTTGATKTANPTSSTVYTISGTNANGCVNTGTITVSVNALPAISAGANRAICFGTFSVLTATGGVTYTWASGSFLSATSGASVTANPPVNRTYTVTGTDANGCVNTASVTVSVNALPSVSGGTSGAICTGSSMALTATGGTTYSWAPSTGLNATTGASITANPASTTTYTVTGLSGAGCSNNSIVTVTVNTLPTVTTGLSYTICSGSSTPTISASGATGYTWLPATGLSVTTGSGVIANPAATTIYTVTGTDANGCSNTASVTVSVNALPVISAGSGAAICMGGSTGLTASGGVSYAWSPSIGLSLPAGSSVTANPTSTTTYTITGTDANGCINTGAVTVTVNSLPTITSTGNNGPICSGVNLNLTSTASGGSSVYSYFWSGPSGFTSTLQNPTISGASIGAMGTYTLSVTDGNGCAAISPATTTASIILAPVVSSIGNGGAVCAGNSLSLNSIITGASGTVTYAWAGPNTFSSSLQNPTISSATVLASGTYTLTATDINGCVATGVNTTTATVNPLPSAGTITGAATVCVGSTTTLTNATAGGVWSAGAGIVTIGSSSGVVTGVAISLETIYYTVTNIYGCSSVATKTINVEGTSGNIYTFTGTGVIGYTGDGGAGYAARINSPRDLSSDTSGNVYFCDVNASVIRKINTNGIVSTIAGTGVAGNTGDGGPATAATLSQPNGIFVARTGDIYFSNTTSHTIRKIAAGTGIITTIAGVTGVPGTTGDGGPASAAKFNLPLGITGDQSGNIYIADQSNYRVRKINLSTGIISTVVGTGSSFYSGDGGPGTAARVSTIRGVALDNANNLYVADPANYTVRKLDMTTGIITTFAGNHTTGFSGDGGPATAAQLGSPARVSFDGGKMLYISDISNNRVRGVNLTTGIITTVIGNGSTGYSGDGTIATTASVWQPTGISCDKSGNVFVADAGNRRIRVASALGTIAISNGSSSTVPAGTSVTFTASTSISSNYATYQWQKNGVNVGTGGTTYTTSSSVNGDIYRCTLVVAPDCSTPFTDTSNSITMTIYGPPPFESTGVTTTSNDGMVSIYPNPAHENFTFSANNIANGDAVINVYDQVGKIVYTTTVQVVDNRLKELIDVSSQSNGIYVVSVTDASGKAVRMKCVKN